MDLPPCKDDHTLAELFKLEIKGTVQMHTSIFLQKLIAFEISFTSIKWFILWTRSGCVFHLSGKDHLYVQCSKHPHHCVIIRPCAVSEGFVLLEGLTLQELHHDEVSP